MNEKRAFKRFAMYQSTFFKSSAPNMVYECLIHDLSLGGVLIETKEILASGDRLTLAIRYGEKVYTEEIEIIRQMRLITLRYGCRFLSNFNREARSACIKMQEST